MAWYYVDKGQQQGPFEEAKLDGLIANGTVTPATYVWKEGLPNWLPLAQVRGVNAVSGDAATCEICRKPVGIDNLIELNGARVCAACKPVALQTMREGVTLGGDLVWADGKKVVARDGTTFPHRCIKCNAETSLPPIKRRCNWHHPALYLLILVGLLLSIGILLYIIIAVIVRRRATAQIFLCPKHRQRRIIYITATWVGIVLSFAVMISSGVWGAQWWIALCLGILLFIGSIVTSISTRLTTTTHISKSKTIWLKGAGKDFLASLPAWPGE